MAATECLHRPAHSHQAERKNITECVTGARDRNTGHKLRERFPGQAVFSNIKFVKSLQKNEAILWHLVNFKQHQINFKISQINVTNHLNKSKPLLTALFQHRHVTLRQDHFPTAFSGLHQCLMVFPLLNVDAVGREGGGGGGER